MKQRNNCFLLIFLLIALFSCREKVVIGNDEYLCHKKGTDSLFCECEDSLQTKHGYVNVVKGVKQGMEYWLNEDHDTVAQAGFIDGKLCGFRKVFYPDGNLKYCGSLINGEQVGWHFHFFDTGELKLAQYSYKLKTIDGIEPSELSQSLNFNKQGVLDSVYSYFISQEIIGDSVRFKLHYPREYEYVNLLLLDWEGKLLYWEENIESLDFTRLQEDMFFSDAKIGLIEVIENFDGELRQNNQFFDIDSIFGKFKIPVGRNFKIE